MESRYAIPGLTLDSTDPGDKMRHVAPRRRFPWGPAAVDVFHNLPGFSC